MSRERVRQIEAKAIRLLRHKLAAPPPRVASKIIQQAQTDYETKELIKRLKATP
jgi:hypothetical protein